MTKERLRHYNALKQEQQQLRDQIDTLEAEIYAPNIQRITGMPSAGSGGNPMENKAIRHIELIEQYGAKLEEIATEREAIEEAIASLDWTARMLLRYRYIDNMTWDDVCVKMNYSWGHIHRIHGAAIAELQAKESEAAKE